MPQVPETIQPALAFIRKHQFWLVLGLLPCVLIPTLLTAQGALDRQVKMQRGRINAKVASIKTVEQKTQHPNAQWKTVIDTETERVRRETHDEWQKLWDSQTGLRVWPAELGDGFIAQVTNLRPGSSLDVTSRARYQTDVRELVKQLPARMGAEEQMATQTTGTGDAKPARTGRGFRLVWRPENQRTIYQSFDWPQMPDDGKAATAQIVQAQEELWVYGLLCDAIRQANAGAKTRFEASILEVAELAVGYLAVEESPGGQGQRFGMAGAGGPAFMGMPSAQSRPKPQHPRFSGAGGRSSAPVFIPGMSPPDVPPPAADAAYREGIYVDFDGKWLTAAELDSGPSRMMHLMPFTLRLVMDERKIEPLLAALASNPIPIDVRQLRINPQVAIAAATAGGGGGGQSTGQVDERKYDVTVELRGTVGLATPPIERPAGQQQPGPAAGAAVRPRSQEPATSGRRSIVSPFVTVPS